jgi:hypothetical protein
MDTPNLPAQKTKTPLAPSAPATTKNPSREASGLTADHIERLIASIDRLALAFVMGHLPPTNRTPSSVVNQARVFAELL